MNVDAFRHFYNYHFAENRKMWNRYITQLTNDQFTQESHYSRGSVRDQLLHLIEVDEIWFIDLRGVEPTDPADLSNYAAIRAHWDNVEKMMRDYLTQLTAEMLNTKPLSGEDENLLLWQVLLHVVNHGTDHRAQILRLLNDMGVETVYQDYIFYVYENG